MSLGVVIKGPEGVVLAVDSRVTLEARIGDQSPLPVNFDNTSKLLTFLKPHDYVGAVTYGEAVVGQRTAHSLIPEFEQNVLTKEKGRLNILNYAKKLSNFFMNRWKESMLQEYRGPGMTFIVGGYNEKDAYGSVYVFGIPKSPNPEPRNPEGFGMTWGGQLQIATRIIHGCDPNFLNIIRSTLNLNTQQVNKIREELKKKLEFPIPYSVLPLQDCVDLAIFLIRSTMTAQRLAVGIRGVGGPIDVAIIKRIQSITFIQKKEIQGESK